MVARGLIRYKSITREPPPRNTRGSKTWWQDWTPSTLSAGKRTLKPDFFLASRLIAASCYTNETTSHGESDTNWTNDRGFAEETTIRAYKSPPVSQTLRVSGQNRRSGRSIRYSRNRENPERRSDLRFSSALTALPRRQISESLTED